MIFILILKHLRLHLLKKACIRNIFIKISTDSKVMYCTVPPAVDLYQTFPYCRQNTALPSLDSCLVLAVSDLPLGDHGSYCM